MRRTPDGLCRFRFGIFASSDDPVIQLPKKFFNSTSAKLGHGDIQWTKAVVAKMRARRSGRSDYFVDKLSRRRLYVASGMMRYSSCFLSANYHATQATILPRVSLVAPCPPAISSQRTRAPLGLGAITHPSNYCSSCITWLLLDFSNKIKLFSVREHNRLENKNRLVFACCPFCKGAIFA